MKSKVFRFGAISAALVCLSMLLGGVVLAATQTTMPTTTPTSSCTLLNDNTGNTTLVLGPNVPTDVKTTLQQGYSLNCTTTGTTTPDMTTEASFTADVTAFCNQELTANVIQQSQLQTCTSAAAQPLLQSLQVFENTPACQQCTTADAVAKAWLMGGNSLSSWAAAQTQNQETLLDWSYHVIANVGSSSSTMSLLQLFEANGMPVTGTTNPPTGMTTNPPTGTTSVLQDFWKLDPKTLPATSNPQGGATFTTAVTAFCSQELSTTVIMQSQLQTCKTYAAAPLMQSLQVFENTAACQQCTTVDAVAQTWLAGGASLSSWATKLMPAETFLDWSYHVVANVGQCPSALQLFETGSNQAGTNMHSVLMDFWNLNPAMLNPTPMN